MRQPVSSPRLAGPTAGLRHNGPRPGRRTIPACPPTDLTRCPRPTDPAPSGTPAGSPWPSGLAAGLAVLLTLADPGITTDEPLDVRPGPDLCLDAAREGWRLLRPVDGRRSGLRRQRRAPAARALAARDRVDARPAVRDPPLRGGPPQPLPLVGPARPRHRVRAARGSGRPRDGPALRHPRRLVGRVRAGGHAARVRARTPGGARHLHRPLLDLGLARGRPRVDLATADTGDGRRRDRLGAGAPDENPRLVPDPGRAPLGVRPAPKGRPTGLLPAARSWPGRRPAWACSSWAGPGSGTTRPRGSSATSGRASIAPRSRSSISGRSTPIATSPGITPGSTSPRPSPSACTCSACSGSSLASRHAGTTRSPACWPASIGLFLVVFSTRVPVYDGERLFLIVFPLWAVFIGRGFAAVWESASQRRGDSRPPGGLGRRASWPGRPMASWLHARSGCAKTLPWWAATPAPSGSGWS